MVVVTAYIVKRQTDDGLVCIEDDIQIGKEYLVKPNSRRLVTLRNTVFGVNHTKEIVDVVDEQGHFQGWYATELLNITNIINFIDFSN